MDRKDIVYRRMQMAGILMSAEDICNIPKLDYKPICGRDWVKYLERFFYRNKEKYKDNAYTHQYMQRVAWKVRFGRTPKLDWITYSLSFDHIEAMSKKEWGMIVKLIQETEAQSEHDIQSLYTRVKWNAPNLSKVWGAVMYWNTVLDITDTETIRWIERNSNDSHRDAGDIKGLLFKGYQLSGGLASMKTLYKSLSINIDGKDRDVSLSLELGRWDYGTAMFNKALKLQHKVMKKSMNTIPAVTLTSGRYTISRLHDGDVRAYTLGDHTDCCQHMGGAGESCVVYGVLKENSCFYIVEREGDDRIQSQAWLWRVDDTVYFDNIESLNSSNTIKELWQSLATALIGKFEIKEVRVGLGHNDEFDGYDSDAIGYSDSELKVLHNTYTDARKYVVLAGVSDLSWNLRRRCVIPQPR